MGECVFMTLCFWSSFLSFDCARSPAHWLQAVGFSCSFPSHHCCWSCAICPILLLLVLCDLPHSIISILVLKLCHSLGWKHQELFAQFGSVHATNQFVLWFTLLQQAIWKWRLPLVKPGVSANTVTNRQTDCEVQNCREGFAVIRCDFLPALGEFRTSCYCSREIWQR